MNTFDYIQRSFHVYGGKKPCCVLCDKRTSVVAIDRRPGGKAYPCCQIHPEEKLQEFIERQRIIKEEKRLSKQLPYDPPRMNWEDEPVNR